MDYQHLITILSDGKTVIARDRTGTEAIARCSPEDEFNLSIGASLAIKRLLEKEAEIKAGDRVRFTENYEPMYVFPYAAEFVEKLSIPMSLKVRYCYSDTRPLLYGEYIVHAVSGGMAYIQAVSEYNRSVSGYDRCYVVGLKILRKVSK